MDQRWVERQGDVVWHREAAVVVEQVIPHSCEVDKNQEGYLGSKRSQPQARLYSTGFRYQGDKSPKLLVVKTSVGGVVEEIARFSGESV